MRATTILFTTLVAGTLLSGSLPVIAADTETGSHLAAAPLSEEPAVLVTHLYDAYLKPEEPPALTPFLSAEAATHPEQGYLAGELKTAAARLAHAQERDPGFSLGYDPLIDGQDFEIKNLTVKTTEKTEHEAKVEVDFLNFGEKRSYEFTLIKPEGATRWYISQVLCKAGLDGRTFSIQSEMEDAMKQAEE